MDITANIATAAPNRNLKNVLSTLSEVINFYHTVNGLYLGKFVYFLIYKWNKKSHRLYPLTPFENKNIDVEQRLEKNLKDVKSFNNSINNF